jgi:hypothetical protein
MSEMKKCKHCDAPMLQIKTRFGNIMECDAKLYEVWRNGGKYRAVTPGGEVISCSLEPDLFAEPELAYLPHYVSCSLQNQARVKL